MSNFFSCLSYSPPHTPAQPSHPVLVFSQILPHLVSPPPNPVSYGRDCYYSLLSVIPSPLLHPYLSRPLYVLLYLS